MMQKRWITIWTDSEKWIWLLGISALLVAMSACSVGDGLEIKKGPSPGVEDETQVPPPDTAVVPSALEITDTPDLLMSTIPSDPEMSDDECNLFSGKVTPYIFQSSRDQTDLEGWIYLPPCYSFSKQARYPVLYLLHGSEASAEQWHKLGIDDTADRLISKGFIPPLIIVMPQESSWRHPSENPFGEHLIKDVIPWIDIHYRTRNTRDDRAIGGLSRGGNWAVRLGLLHWSSFSRVGAHSTPLFRGDLQKISEWLDGIPDPLVPSMYLDIGESDQHLSQARELEGVLLAEGVPYEWHLNPGLHDDDYWQAHLEDYLFWYTRDWLED